MSASHDLSLLFRAVETLRRYQHESSRCAICNGRLPNRKCHQQLLRIKSIAARIDADALNPNAEEQPNG